MRLTGFCKEEWEAQLAIESLVQPHTQKSVVSGYVSAYFCFHEQKTAKGYPQKHKLRNSIAKQASNRPGNQASNQATRRPIKQESMISHWLHVRLMDFFFTHERPAFLGPLSTSYFERSFIWSQNGPANWLHQWCFPLHQPQKRYARKRHAHASATRSGAPGCTTTRAGTSACSMARPASVQSRVACVASVPAPKCRALATHGERSCSSALDPFLGEGSPTKRPSMLTSVLINPCLLIWGMSLVLVGIYHFWRGTPPTLSLLIRGQHYNLMGKPTGGCIQNERPMP